jgi:hypothetical protein
MSCSCCLPRAALAAQSPGLIRGEAHHSPCSQRGEAYRVCGASVGSDAQTRELPGVKELRPEYRAIGSHVLQDVIRHVERAFASFVAHNSARAILTRARVPPCRSPVLGSTPRQNPDGVAQAAEGSVNEGKRRPSRTPG